MTSKNICLSCVNEERVYYALSAYDKKFSCGEIEKPLLHLFPCQFLTENWLINSRYQAGTFWIFSKSLKSKWPSTKREHSTLFLRSITSTKNTLGYLNFEISGVGVGSIPGFWPGLWLIGSFVCVYFVGDMYSPLDSVKISVYYTSIS